MTEIRIDVDLPHTRERVWTALTDPRVLRQWFMEIELGEQKSDGFVLRPAGQPGFDAPIDGEIIEVESQRRIVVQWRSPQLHTLVTITVQPVQDGCRLAVVQRGFLGAQGTLRRRLLQRTYRDMMDRGLPEALEQLAAAERERERAKQPRSRSAAADRHRGGRRNEARFFLPGTRQALAGLIEAGRNMARLRPSTGGAGSGLGQPPVRGVAAPAGEALRESETTPIVRGSWRRGRRSQPRGHHGGARHGGGEGGAVDGRSAVAASVVILLLLAVLAVLVDRITAPGGPGSGGVSGERDPRSILVPGNSPVNAAARRVGTAASPRSGESSTARPSSVTLVAVYRTDRPIVGGYEGIVTINNLSTGTVTGWSVRMVLPPLGLVVRSAQGAEVAQRDKEIRFSPTEVTKVVAVGEPVRFTFQVQGVGAPIECTINNQPCSGIPE